MKLAVPVLLLLAFGGGAFTAPMRFAVSTVSAREEAINPTPSVESLGISGGGR